MEPIVIQHTGKNFVECLEIINKIGGLAEAQNHHPDIKLHSYKHIEFTLFTHDVGTVTEKDTKLAEDINSLLSEYK